jgi:amidase
MSTSENSRESRQLNRRNFLRGSALGAAAVAIGPAGCTTPSGEVGGEHGVGNREAYPVDFEFDEISIGDLQSLMDEGAESSVSITSKYLDRIRATNQDGPELRAIIELNPDALDIAEQLDVERRSTGPRGPLHGIPVVLKDNIETADRMTTTAGSFALEGSIASEDSEVAARLRAAGAVLLAKANLSEWANFRSSRSTGGWSARGGLCVNPYALDRNACGSSSGSGVAVSANLCPVAIGTETDGSVVCPSSITGIVGIKPSLGLVGQKRIIPIVHTQDTAGPMARTVEDVAIVLTAMSSDGRDYAADLDPGALQGARIGAARKYLGYHPAVDAIFEDALAALSEAGAVIVDPADLPTHGEWGSAEYEVLLYEFKHDLNQYLNGLNPAVQVRSLEDLIKFNEEHSDLEMPYFGQERLLDAVEKGPLTDQAYLEALEKCRRLTRAEGIDSLMDSEKLDAIVAPTTGPAWVNDLVMGGHRSHGASSAAAVSGYPSITVPSGFVHGLPVGLLFFGRAASDKKLIQFAYAFEQGTNTRRKPELLETVRL